MSFYSTAANMLLNNHTRITLIITLLCRFHFRELALPLGVTRLLPLSLPLPRNPPGHNVTPTNATVLARRYTTLSVSAIHPTHLL